ncbi:MAG: PhzF family phenazine biosynthesis protein [Planctomycetota bacterium]
MKVPIYQVDAFTGELFRGNPAAVCPLEAWLPESTMLAIAAENQLSETAFFVPEGGGDRFGIRWFTPSVEVDLCGHATLASAFVILHLLEPRRREVTFTTRAVGTLTVAKEGDRLTLNFPARPPRTAEPPADLPEILGASPEAFLEAGEGLAVLADAETVVNLKPDLRRVADLEGLGLIVTAPGKDCDFVSRFFAPKVGIPEDPVTGAVHCILVPYWAKRLGKTELHARQVSARGGELFCEDVGNRVLLSGNAVLYLEGTIHVPEPF